MRSYCDISASTVELYRHQVPSHRLKTKAELVSHLSCSSSCSSSPAPGLAPPVSVDRNKRTIKLPHNNNFTALNVFYYLSSQQ